MAPQYDPLYSTDLRTGTWGTRKQCSSIVEATVRSAGSARWPGQSMDPQLRTLTLELPYVHHILQQKTAQCFGSHRGPKRKLTIVSRRGFLVDAIT